MTSAGYPLRVEPLEPGDAFISRFAAREQTALCVALHEATYGRLREALTRPAGRGGAPGDLLVHGALGIGKTTLLRRLYWDLFESQDEVAPVLHRVNPMPFRPVQWARRFALEAVQQWLAWERSDARLASRGVMSAAELRAMCHEARLAPLARFLDRAAVLGDSGDGAEAVLGVLEGLATAAEDSGRRVALMIDESRYAQWTDGDGEYWLTRVASSLSASPVVHRVWAMRHGPERRHPLLTPQPDAVEAFPLEALSESAAARFVERLASRAGVRCDASVLRDFLYLWGGVPAWLARFVSEASDSPRDINSEELLVDVYVGDVARGATAHVLEEALCADGAEAMAPERVAETAEMALLWDGATTAPSGEGDAEALRRLAMAGVAEPGPRGWRVSKAPVLQDFLRLFVTRHYHGRNLARNEVALKRHRLVEQAALRANEGGEAEDARRRLSIFLHGLRGQSVAQQYFMAHRRTTASETVPGSLAAAVAGRWVELPHALGVFDEETDGARGEERLIGPGVVAWCFDEPGFYRSDESAWVAYPCDASVVTTEELDEADRRVRRLGRELGLGRVTTWIVADGRYSPEAAERVETTENLLASTWADFDKISETVMAREGIPSIGRGRGESDSSRSRRPRIVRTDEETALGERVVELYLPPVPDMELTAAQSVEQLARDAGYNEQTAGEIRMATLEACLNAIERSRNGEKEVFVRLAASPDKFTVLVENEGASFDPQNVEAPSLGAKLGSSYKRGWGLALMQKFMDRVVYEPYDRGTRLRMTKRNATPDVPRGPTGREAAQHERSGGLG